MPESRLEEGQGGVLGRPDNVGKVKGQESVAHLRNVGDWRGLECGM